MRRTALVAAAALAVSALSIVTTTTARADPQAVTQLPPGPGGMHTDQISAWGADVYAVFGSNSSTGTLYHTLADGSGSWEQVTDPVGHAPIDDPYAVRDGVIVTLWGGSAYRVIAGDSQWDTTSLPGYTSTVRIGAGGRLVEVQRWVADEGRYHYDVYDAEAGAAGGQVASTFSPPGLTGTWVWTIGEHGVLTGHDVSGSNPDRHVNAGDDCASATIEDAVGDPTSGPAWAMLECSLGADKPVVVDLTGKLRPLIVATGRLGQGFTYAGTASDAGSVVRVFDFGHALATQDYGPWTSGALWGDQRSGSMSASTDAGTPYLAFLTTGGAISVAPLPWLTPAPTKNDDTTAPRVTSTTGSSGAVRRGQGFLGTPLTFGWTEQDDDQAHPAADVQVRETISSGPGWQPVDGARRLLTNEIEYDEPNWGHVCFRVRLHDRVGNRSAWSTPRCTWVDDSRPSMTDAIDDTNGLLRVLRSVGRVDVTGRFHGDDDSYVTSYDVQRRIAPPARAFGPWTAPRRWQGVARTRVTASLAPGAEICFRARAHDAVGRVSTWGDKRCATEPYDDASWSGHHAVSRHVQGALGGTATRLTHGRQSLSHAHLSGRVLWVRARGAGCPWVWWGGKRVMSLGCSDEYHGFGWYAISFRHRHSGTIRVAIGDYWGWTEVDAIAVGR
jgi:hypothetical protein